MKLAEALEVVKGDRRGIFKLMSGRQSWRALLKACTKRTCLVTEHADVEGRGQTVKKIVHKPLNKRGTHTLIKHV